MKIEITPMTNGCIIKIEAISKELKQEIIKATMDVIQKHITNVEE